MIKPQSHTYSCPECGWSKDVAMASDVLGLAIIILFALGAGMNHWK